jgi:MYXO-CTERM domain-containing protein
MAPIETSSPRRSFRQLGFRACAAALVGGVILAFSSPASAKPQFPQVMVDTLGEQGLDCTPTCSMCHTSPSPDSGNAAQPIANNLLSFTGEPGPGGKLLPDVIEPENLPLFLEALQTLPCANMNDAACMTGAMPCEKCDGDGDGDDDIAELLVDSDPNLPAAKLACPQYGCGAHIAPERPSRPLDGTAALAALSVAAVLLRRFRRR